MISLDTKRFLRKKKFWIAIVSVIVVALVNFGYSGRGGGNHFDNLYQQAQANNEKLFMRYDSSYCIDEDTYVQVQRTLNGFVQDMEEAHKAKDWKQLNTVLKKQNLMLANAVYQVNKDSDQSKLYHAYFKQSDAIMEMVKQNDLGFPLNLDVVGNYQFLYSDLFAPEDFVDYQFSARFYDQLEKQDIGRMDYTTLDSTTVFIHFLRNMFPLLPIILVGILCYDALQEDRDSGVARILLSLPIKRVTYIRKKLATNMKSVLMVFLMPMLIISLGLGLFDHFHTLKAPILANVEGITSFQTLENSLDGLAKRNFEKEEFLGLTKYYPMPEYAKSPNPEFDFMELWQFVVLVLFMAVLVLMFMVLFHILCTVIFRNKMLALVVSLLVLLIASFLAQPSNVGLLYALVPFTFFNPVDILSGYTSYSYLNGILILSMYNIILYLLIVWLYNKKDIVS